MIEFYQSLYELPFIDNDLVGPIAGFVLDNLHWIILLFVTHFTVLGMVAYLILLERKTASWVQDRVGPNRVGFDFGLDFMPKFHFWGLGQPLADGLKFIVKEDYASKHTDKVLFTLAPMAMVITVIISIAVIPWGGTVGERVEAVDVKQAVFTAMNNDVPVGQAVVETITGPERAAYGFRRGNDIIGDVEVAFVPAGVTITDEAVQVVRFDAQGRLEPGTVLPETIAVTDRVVATFIQGWHFQIANLNIGVLFVLAALSLAVYGIVVGGWASNNKYSFLGGLRATANMISYEIPLGLSVLIVVIMFATLDLGVMVSNQADYWFGIIPAWNVFAHPLAFFMFLICIHAEANRAPFDNAEAEQELVGGYHTEYSSMRFAIFFLAEYAGMVTTSAVCVALFFGGWHIPYLDYLFPSLLGGAIDPADRSIISAEFWYIAILRMGVFMVKTVLILFIFMWVRWSLPRFRFDQIMQIAWRSMIPIGLLLVIGTTVVVVASGGNTVDGLSGWEALAMLGMNVVVLGLLVVGRKIVPTAPDVNKKVRVPGSRFARTPLPKATA
ncbi:MAG: complex I subunit 1 family protein [Planctomycetota bacterium]